jgi:hypothetical protein
MLMKMVFLQILMSGPSLMNLPHAKIELATLTNSSVNRLSALTPTARSKNIESAKFVCTLSYHLHISLHHQHYIFATIRAQCTIVNETSTLRCHAEAKFTGKYCTWAKANAFTSKLPGDLAAEKKNAVQAQQQINVQLTECKLSECAIPYTHQNFRKAAIEWLVTTDQVRLVRIDVVGCKIMEFSPYRLLSTLSSKK